MYESFYLRAVSPREPVGVWIRHTVQKPAGRSPHGSVWCTVFDAAGGRPFMHKQTSDRVSAPAGEWIEVGDQAADGQGGVFGPGGADGACGPAEWSLRLHECEPELRHLPREWLYGAPLPRTKLTSPAPRAELSGRVQIPGRAAIELDGWAGMVGHNWGSEHAERWIWLHGVDFDGAGQAWIDVALGRIELGGRLTPWVANGSLSLDGRRLRIGGLGARGLQVNESPEGCTLRLPCADGKTVRVRAEAPDATAAGWRYGDPDGGEDHDVVNCSIASLTMTVESPEGEQRSLHTAHGGVYELGMREHDHGVPIAPFDDE
jgi:hypothetical protein